MFCSGPAEDAGAGEDIRHLQRAAIESMARIQHSRALSRALENGEKGQKLRWEDGKGMPSEGQGTDWETV